MSAIIKCPACGRERRVEARGLCHTCYERARSRGLLSGFPRRAPMGDMRQYWRERKRRERALEKRGRL